MTIQTPHGYCSWSFTLHLEEGVGLQKCPYVYENLVLLEWIGALSLWQELLFWERQAGNLKKQHHCNELYSLFHRHTNVITLIYWCMERSSTFSMEDKQFMVYALSSKSLPNTNFNTFFAVTLLSLKISRSKLCSSSCNVAWTVGFQSQISS